MKIVWSAKKSLALAGALFTLVGIGLCFVPMFTCVDAGVYYYGNVIESFLHPEEPKLLWLTIGGFAAFVALLILADVFLVRSIRARTDDGDKEDKFFVFGFAFSTLGFAFLSLFCLATNHRIAIFLGILGILVDVISIIVHFKKLSNV